MTLDPVALAIPLFVAFILAEALWAYRQGSNTVGFEDAVAALATGICQRALLLVVGAALLVPYAVLAEHAPVVLPIWAQVLVAIFGVDFAYYLWHRWTHESNLGWATHVVHHQSEHYNLAVALRQSLTEPFTSFPFYLPLALMGVGVEVFAAVAAVNLLYQFFLHTEAVRRLGVLETVLNTPSHHRVHHGINRVYLDKNYAGMFIIWDRWLGTFEPERDRVVYGTLKPAQTFEPLWANLQWFVVVGAMARQVGPRVWLRSPAWQPPGAPDIVPEHVIASRLPYAPEGSKGYRLAVVAQVGVVATLLCVAMLTEGVLTTAQRGVVAIFLVIPCVAWGDLFEGRRRHRLLQVVWVSGLPLLGFWLAG